MIFKAQIMDEAAVDIFICIITSSWLTSWLSTWLPS